MSASGKKRPIVLRVLAAAGALGVLVVLFLLTNSFTGNPVSAYFSKQDMIRYAEKTYPQLNLRYENATYNFKFGNYQMRVADEDSIDTRFTIYRHGGGRIRDDYDTQVTERQATLQRMEEEMAQVLRPSFEEAFPGALTGRFFVDYMSMVGPFAKGETAGEMIAIPPLDSPFSAAWELPMTLFIDLEVPEQPTPEQMYADVNRMQELLTGYRATPGYYQVGYRFKQDGSMREAYLRVHTSRVNSNLPQAIRDIEGKDGYYDEEDTLSVTMPRYD